MQALACFRRPLALCCHFVGGRVGPGSRDPPTRILNPGGRVGAREAPQFQQRRAMGSRLLRCYCCCTYYTDVCLTLRLRVQYAHRDHSIWPSSRSGVYPSHLSDSDSASLPWPRRPRGPAPGPPFIARVITALRRQTSWPARCQCLRTSIRAGP
jgi:hypothetical protein